MPLATMTITDRHPWVEVAQTEYPFTAGFLNIPTIPKDPYERNVPSLLASMTTFAESILTDMIKFRNPDAITVPKQATFSLTEIHLLCRICNNTLTSGDYMILFQHILGDRPSKRTTAFHLDFLQRDEREICDNLPSLTVYSEIMISTFTAKGNVILFLILPSQATVEMYLTSRIDSNEVDVHFQKLHAILQRAFNRPFVLHRRLQVPDNFHPNSFIMTLLLGYSIFRRKEYLMASEDAFIHFKSWLAKKFIKLHDYYLGRLSISDITPKSHPFFTIAHKGQDNVDEIEKNGWFVMDVQGDGNCGYYSLLLAFQNVGIRDYHIDTSGDKKDTPMNKNKPWQKQVIKLRTDLRAAARELLKLVYPAGSKSRKALWWVDCVGAYDDETFDALPGSFLIPGEKNDAVYFKKAFTENAELLEYHMNPYWTALVVAYLFNVRVVVVTRNASPVRKTKPNDTNKEQIDTNTEQNEVCEKEQNGDPESAEVGEKEQNGDPESPEVGENVDESMQDDDENDLELQLKYYTKIFEFEDGFRDKVKSFKKGRFDDDFREHIEKFVPVTEHETCVRIDDTEYKSKKTIEILYCTGFNAACEPTLNHFMFLRRVLFSSISTDITVSKRPLVDFLQTTDTSETPPNIPTATAAATVEETQPKTSNNSGIPIGHDLDAEGACTPSLAQTAEEIQPIGHALDVEGTQAPSVAPTAEVFQPNASSKPGIEPGVVFETEGTNALSGDLQLVRSPEDHSIDETLMEMESPPPNIDTPSGLDLDDSSRLENESIGRQDTGGKVTGKRYVPEKVLPPSKRPRTTTRGKRAPVKQARSQTSQKGKRGKKAAVKQPQSQAPRESSRTGKQPPVRQLQDETHEEPDESSRPRTEEHLLYDARTGRFRVGIFNNEKRRYTRQVILTDVSYIEDRYVREARETPNTWIAPPLGDPGTNPPPPHLTTRVKLLYEQFENHFCLTYSFASALFYCRFKDEAIALSKQAKTYANMSMNPAIASLRSLMPNLVPAIGGATIYGKRCSGNNKCKRPFTFDHLFSDITPYPTLVIPVTGEGRMSHCFTVVDNLIFDAISPYALKLCMESIQWIFNDDPDISIYCAYRFNMKVSPKKHKLPCKYTRQVTYH